VANFCRETNRVKRILPPRALKGQGARGAIDGGDFCRRRFGQASLPEILDGIDFMGQD